METLRPTQEPEDNKEFEYKLNDASSQAEVDRLIEGKANQILRDLNAERRQEELREIVESRIEEAISPRIYSTSSYTIINELSTDNLDKKGLIRIILDKINIRLSRINQGIEDRSNSRSSSERETSVSTDLFNLLSTIQNELTMLKQQLESQLDNDLELEGTPIQDALDQYRRFKSKLEGLSEDSPEQEDIRRVLNIYAEYIKQEFEQSPEKYAIGKSWPVDVDIETIVNDFIEPNDLTNYLTNEQKSHQRNIAEARKNITLELSQTPGVLGVIPMARETEGSKRFDIIAITLKPNTNLSPEKVDTALKLLYSQIQTSANSKKAEIKANILDPNNIEIYSNGQPLADFTEDNKPESELNPSQIFQLHTIKVAKRSTDFQYKEEYTDHAMAMARPSQSLENNNIPTLTNSYTTQEGTHLILAPFNQAMFQLSAQKALGLEYR